MSSSSDIFVRRIVHEGQEILRPLVFYVGLNKEGKAAITRLIRQHGGSVVGHPGNSNSNILPLVDANAKGKENCRVAYSVDFITRCVEENKLLNWEEFRIPTPKTPGRKVRGRVRKRVLQSRKKSSAEIPQNGGKASAAGAEEPSGLADEKIPAVPDKSNPGNITGNGGKGQSDIPEVKLLAVDKVIDDESTLDDNLADGDAGEGHAKSGEIDCARERTEEHDEKGDMDNEESKQGDDNGQKKDECVWEPKEDAMLLELYEDAEDIYKEKNKDIALLAEPRFWARMYNKELLPSGRNPEECRSRLLAIRDRTIRKRQKGQIKLAVIKRGTDSEEDSVTPAKRLHAVKEPTRIRNKEGPKEGRSSSSSLSSEPAIRRSLRKRPDDGSIKVKIRKMISKLAKLGNCSEKRAFRALRKERGDWRKALKCIERSKDER